ncbi:MAG: hypothetical protein PUD59_05605 [bacterium]|nr:hypothetical protein [bacterium]
MNKISKVIETGVAVDMAANEISQNSQMNKQEKQIFNDINKEVVYEVDKSKRKKLFKIYSSDYKKTMPQKHKWVYTFYITSILLLLAVIITTIACVVLIEDSFDRTVISSLIFIFGLAFDILPYSAYKFSVNMTAFGEFYYRKKEKIVVNENGFDYLFYDKRVNYLDGVAMFKYSVNYKDIKQVLYDERVKELIIVGVKCYQYIGNNEWKSLDYYGVGIQEIFKFNILENLKKNNVLVKEMDYLVQREEEKKAMEEALKNKE